MLVLTRRLDQEILFPNTGIRIRIVGVKGSTVRVGIEAPTNVLVLREEVAREQGITLSQQTPATSHAIRNRLNKVTLGLHRVRQLTAAAQTDEANAQLHQVLAVLEALDQDWPLLTSSNFQAPALPRIRCRTLLVEDDANERELLAGILGMNGCECETAADGQEALDYLSSHDLPDFVLLDMGLPRLNGVQTLERIRQEPRCRGLKVFAVSGALPADLGVATGTGGVDAWFTKPLNPRGLWEAIQQTLAGQSGAN